MVKFDENYTSVQFVENYALAQFDETICFFKLMENVRLNHRLYEVYFIDSLPWYIVTVSLPGVIFSHGTADLSRPMRARRAKALEGRGGDGG